MTLLQVWAPAASSVGAVVDGVPVPLQAADGGWWRSDVPAAVHGTDYGFLLDDDAAPLADPRTPWQPHGVHGLSRVYDHDRFEWTDAGWRGVALQGSVVYELHIGTFTAERTLDAAIEHLDHLVELGVDLVELMPVAAFPGSTAGGTTACTRTPSTSPTAARTR